ncbi:hypothetical protein LCGC14_3060800 [marine sediment metagenome]|uniref:Uncharacterized protein n=1 Tax=marine sediment metagenome TaxID=412755 RepID=A0A0F8X775_9ZZZZ
MTIFQCSECNVSVIHINTNAIPCCPECGAKMYEEWAKEEKK